MRDILRAAAFGLALMSFGCGSPCEELADIACAAAGEGSEECSQVREKAGRASADDKRSCDVALELVKSVEKQR